MILSLRQKRKLRSRVHSLHERFGVQEGRWITDDLTSLGLLLTSSID